MLWKPDDYRLAALERIGEANALRREERWVVAMYVAGVAAEGMLRAYHHEDRPFNERHDLVELFRNCDLERLGESARRRLRGPLQTAHLLWRNAYRFAHETMVRVPGHRDQECRAITIRKIGASRSSRSGDRDQRDRRIAIN